MTCLTCAHWKPKDSGPMARQGYALCALGPRWTFLSLHHTCAKRLPASPEVTAARQKWAAR
jgi:hypothetical protein